MIRHRDEQARDNSTRPTRRNITAAPSEEDIPQSAGPCLIYKACGSQKRVHVRRTPMRAALPSGAVHDGRGRPRFGLGDDVDASDVVDVRDERVETTRG